MLSSSSSSLLSAHRRRSYSAAPANNSTECKTPDSTACRASLKRAYRPVSPMSPDPLCKWDVELWRRGSTKRARHWEKQSTMNHHPPYDVPGALAGRVPLPSSSAEFQLFPRKRRSQRSTRRSSLRLSASSSRTGPEMSYSSTPPEPSADLTRLRSDALSDLHRIVAESGEGMVSRMRDWEQARTETGRGFGMYEAHPDEEMDGSWRRKPRTMSMGDVDVEMAAIEPSCLFSQDRSPDLSSDSCATDTDTDEEDDVEFSLHSSSPMSPSMDSLGTPALSHTLSTSANSSIASLLLLPSLISQSAVEVGEPVRGGTPRPQRPSLAHVASASSRSEKALAALTLALANGAGGVNDYQDILQLDPRGADAPMEESHVGGLWD